MPFRTFVCLSLPRRHRPRGYHSAPFKIYPLARVVTLCPLPLQHAFQASPTYACHNNPGHAAP
eukprot:9225098-Alexandrium_andersonii.AAC.1